MFLFMQQTIRLQSEKKEEHEERHSLGLKNKSKNVKYIILSFTTEHVIHSNFK